MDHRTAGTAPLAELEFVIVGYRGGRKRPPLRSGSRETASLKQEQVKGSGPRRPARLSRRSSLPR